MVSRLSSVSSDEEWRPVIEWEGVYEVSSEGRVRSLDRVSILRDGREIFYPGRYLKLKVNNGGHLYVRLNRPGDRNVQRYVHRLVMQSFVGECPSGMEVCHNNGDPTDNRVDNLRYDTHSSNVSDRRAHGTDKQVLKKSCPRGHNYKDWNIVPYFAKRGHRSCLACSRARARVSYYPELASDVDDIADLYYRKLESENNEQH